MVGRKQENRDMAQAIRVIQAFVQAGKPLQQGITLALATPGQAEGTRAVLQQLERLCNHIYQSKEKITRESLDTQLQRILPALPQTRTMIAQAITKEKPNLFPSHSEMMVAKAVQLQVRGYEMHLTTKCQQAVIKGELAITRNGFQPTPNCSPKTQALLERYQVIHEMQQALHGKKALSSGDVDMAKKSIARCSAMHYAEPSERSFIQKLFSVGDITRSYRDRVSAERQLAKGIDKTVDLLNQITPPSRKL